MLLHQWIYCTLRLLYEIHVFVFINLYKGKESGIFGLAATEYISLCYSDESKPVQLFEHRLGSCLSEKPLTGILQLKMLFYKGWNLWISLVQLVSKMMEFEVK